MLIYIPIVTSEHRDNPNPMLLYSGGQRGTLVIHSDAIRIDQETLRRREVSSLDYIKHA